MEDERQTLAKGSVKVGSLVLLEARTVAGESDAEIVDGGWDFDGTRQGYSCYLKILDRRPGSVLKSEAGQKKLFRLGDPVSHKHLRHEGIGLSR